MPPPTVRPTGRPPSPWAILVAAVIAQAGASVAINGPAFLIPALVSERGLSLAQAGTLAVMPVAGVTVALYLWGIAVDRAGERLVLGAGLIGTTLAGTAALAARSTVATGAALFAVGLFAASTSSASGRVVVGWFPPQRRGLAMGVRQMAQPLGLAVAAVSMAFAADAYGVRTALAVPVLASALALAVVLALVVDPARPEPTPDLTANPYRVDGFLARIHGVSVLLVVPQFLVWTYSLAWLVQERDWSPAAAGALLAGTHALGAAGRIAVGHLSDVVGSRVRPLRWVAASAAAVMAAWALTEPYAVAVLVMVAASAVTVADNGLAFTSVAERAGSFWSGRALGVQNTAQYLVATTSAPLAGLAITAWGYSATFALAAACPLLALGVIPREDRTSGDHRVHDAVTTTGGVAPPT